MSKSCRYCNTIENLIKNKNLCKKCHAEKNLDMWRSLSKEEKQKRGRNNYLHNKAKQIQLSKDNIDYTVKKWIQKWKNRWVDSDFLASRKNLNSDQLFVLAKEGLEKFPYMDFSISKSVKKGYWASVDRINSEEDYSNINNLQFVPFWLNSGKVDLSIDELKYVMKDFLNKKI